MIQLSWKPVSRVQYSVINISRLSIALNCMSLAQRSLNDWHVPETDGSDNSTGYLLNMRPSKQWLEVENVFVSVRFSSIVKVSGNEVRTPD